MDEYISWCHNRRIYWNRLDWVLTLLPNHGLVYRVCPRYVLVCLYTAVYLRGIIRVINCLPSLGQNRSEEHTSELQSRFELVCRLLLEKTKITSVNIGWTIHH